MASGVIDKSSIPVDDYYDVVHRKTWLRRTAGLMTGATLGLLFGVPIGAAAAFVPYVFGVAEIATAVQVPTLAAIGSSAALFGGMAAFIGIPIATDVGANSASISAGMEEKERREKLERVQNGAELSDLAPAPKKKETIPQLFNWKVAAITVAICAAFGALLAINPASASVLAQLGFPGATAATATAAAQGASGAAIAASATMFGMLGITFGFTVSYITNKISNFYTSLLSGKMFEPATEKSPAVQSQPDRVKSDEKSLVVEEEKSGCRKKFAETEKRFSLEAIMDKTDRPDSVLTR